jgi:hypothetical protein
MNGQYTKIKRVWAGLLALTFGLVFVGDSLHLAMYEHVQCAEHGELVHVHEKGAEHGHGDSGLNAHRHLHGRTVFGVSVMQMQAELEHDHCVLLLANQEDALEVMKTKSLQSGSLDFTVQAWILIGGSIEPQIALIHRAPKNAPPV